MFAYQACLHSVYTNVDVCHIRASAYALITAYITFSGLLVFACSLTPYLSVHCFAHSLTHSHMHTHTTLSTHPLIHSPSHLPTLPLICSITPSPPHTLTPSHPHTLTPSLQVQASLKNLADRRTDIFGVEETVIGHKV